MTAASPESPADPTQEFLRTLPEVRPGEEFWFGCHPGVPCFNACCSDLTMPLTPYDVLRLCQGLSMGSEEFFEEFAVTGCYEDTGFPLLHLRMLDAPHRPCPFVTEKGCGVYAHRSSACRTYPLGRATRPMRAPESEGAKDTTGAFAIQEQFFLVREDHCKGFAEQGRWTTAAWLKDQGLEPYNRMNDRYMRLIARYKNVAEGAVLSGRHATMALLCLYQQDRFAEFMDSVSLFSRLTLQGEYAGKDRDECIRAIRTDADARLWFAFDWIELVLFGRNANLAPAGGS